MTVRILSENLQKKISFLSHAISSKNPLPILQNIMLVAQDGELILSATDLEIGIQIRIPAKVETEGAVVIPAKTFIELISSLPTETIMLTLKNKTLELTGKKVTSSFQTTDIDEFPKLYEQKGEKVAVFTKEELQQKLNPVLFAAGVDPSRPALSGIYVKQDTAGILFVATDAFRLSLQFLQHTETESSDSSLLVQARAMREIAGFKGEGEIAMYVSHGGNQILFEDRESVLVGRLIEAQFPAYEKILPISHTTQVVFDREELLKAVRIASIFAREMDNVIRLSIKTGMIEVEANNASVGQNTVQVEATLSGEENEIAFNAKYLLDALMHISAQTLAFETAGPLSAGVFKIQGDDSFLHMIMPIRVQE